MKVKEIASAFIALFKDGDDAISNLKLQKLLYYAQGFSYQRFNHSLFDEDIEAWDDGPVVYDVYKHYQSCGRDPIRVSDSVHLPPIIERLVLDVAREYGQYTTSKLVSMTHRAGTPWAKTYVYGKKRNVIPKSLIADYFSSTEPILESLDIESLFSNNDSKLISEKTIIPLSEWDYE